MNNKDLLLIITMGILLLCPVIGCFGEREGLAFYKSNKWDDIRNKGRRFYGNGESSNRPPSYFEEKKHELYVRDDGDIYIDCHIDYPDAVVGTEVEVPTLDGKVKMKIPSGINNNQLLRLKGKGLPILNRHSEGDLYVKIFIKTITGINYKTKNLIEELRNNINSKIEFKKMKDFQ